MCDSIFTCINSDRKVNLPCLHHLTVCVCPPQRIALTDMTRSEINELLEKLGFYKKSQPEDEVPEEFRFSPAKDSPFKDEPAYKPSTSTPATENASSEPNAEVKHTDL